MRYFLKNSIFVLFFAIFCFPAASNGQVIDSIFYGWAVHEYEPEDGSRQCYVSSFPTTSDSNHTSTREAYLIVTRYAKKRTEEVSVYSGYEYKLNSPVFVLANNNQFKFFVDGDVAWLKTGLEDKALIEEMLRSTLVKVRSDSSVGTFAVDQYSMKGFTRAYARMRELCQ